MLASLTIRNVVLIEQLTLQLAPGFGALTGETGAGKSILLDSLGLALGRRADSGLVRHGAEQANVAAEFQVGADHPVLAFLAGQAIEPDQTLIFRRTVTPDGRSRAFINDQPVSAGLLAQAGAMLVEIHGQFDTHGLFDAGTHRGLLDLYAGLDGGRLAVAWETWRQAAAALATAKAEADRAKADEDYLRHVVAELDDLAPETGEEERLSIQRDAAKHRAQVMSALDEAYEAISGDDGAEMSAARAARVLERAASRIPEPLDDMLAALDRAGQALQEAVGQLERLRNVMVEDDLSPEAIEDRLHDLRAAARKHGCRPDDLVRQREEMSARLASIDSSGGRLDGLAAAVAAARTTYVAEAAAVSDARRKAAAKLDGLVAKELPPLKLEKAQFMTGLDDLPESQWGSGGVERVQFLVATNPSSAPGPLGKIASGGELARFTLALKVVMAFVGSAETYIFDEVDTGIGGATAAAVGERLARLAKTRQVLVVTHSPQVAARAGHHWIVAKQGAQDVRTNVLPLEQRADRRDEIARMLSGATVTDEARAAADRLLETGS